jgi:hypothetical protein
MFRLMAVGFPVFFEILYESREFLYRFLCIGRVSCHPAICKESVHSLFDLDLKSPILVAQCPVHLLLHKPDIFHRSRIPKSRITSSRRVRAGEEWTQKHLEIVSLCEIFALLVLLTEVEMSEAVCTLRSGEGSLGQ